MNASPPDRIELRGIRALGRHGVLPEEHQRPQPFSVDVDLVADLGESGQSDQLDATIDYGMLAEAVVAEIEGPSVQLLERLAQRIADRALAFGGPRARSVTVTLRKLRPPVPVHMESAGVRVTRP